MEILNHLKGTSQRQLDFHGFFFGNVSIFILTLGVNLINKTESS